MTRLPLLPILMLVGSCATDLPPQHREPVKWHGYTIGPDGIEGSPPASPASPPLPRVAITPLTGIGTTLFDPSQIREEPPQQHQDTPRIHDGSVTRRALFCSYLNAGFKYGAATDGPLAFPPTVTPPAPNAANAAMTGPVDGPFNQTNVWATAFEFHANLNGVVGCRSEQGRQSLLVPTVKIPGAVPGVVGDPTGTGFGLKVPFSADAGYTGGTLTGVRRANGGVLYEGTPNTIHWIDAPILQTGPNAQRANHVLVNIVLLKSVIRNGDGKSGANCYSSHYIVVDYNAAGVPSTMNPAAARTYLSGLQPNGAAPGEPPAAGQVRAATANILGAPAANGGFQGKTNPEFRDLGCMPF